MKKNELVEPMAKKVDKILKMHDHERNDEFYWLNERGNQEVIDYLNAEKYYNISLKLDDQSIATMHGLAMTYDNLQKWDMSDDLYIQLIALNQNDAQAYNNYAYSLVERNEEIDYALTLAEKAIEISPNTSAYLVSIFYQSSLYMSDRI